MSQFFQSILWCAAGVIGTVVIIKLFKTKSSDGRRAPQPITRISNSHEPIKVVPYPSGSAKEAFLANVSNMAPLFDALNKGEEFNENVNDAIIEINNIDLMNLWTKICNDHKAIIRILASWGIKKEDEIKFYPQNHHIDRYKTNTGQPIKFDQTYKVLEPCWIWTSVNKDGSHIKTVIKKSIAADEKN